MLDVTINKDDADADGRLVLVYVGAVFQHNCVEITDEGCQMIVRYLPNQPHLPYHPHNHHHCHHCHYQHPSYYISIHLLLQRRWNNDVDVVVHGCCGGIDTSRAGSATKETESSSPPIDLSKCPCSGPTLCSCAPSSSKI